GGEMEPEDNFNQSESQDKTQGDAVATAQVTGAADTSEDTGAEDKNSANDNPQGFANLGLPDKVQDAVAKVGYTTPSPLPRQPTPPSLPARAVVSLAVTGSGTTAAFALPVLSPVATNARHPQASVLAPTRALALQVADSFRSCADHWGRSEVPPISGG